MIAQRRRHTLGQILVWRSTRSLFFCSSQSFCDRCGRTPTTTRDRSLCGSEGFVSACTVICIVWLSHARARTLAQDREQTNTHAQNYHTIGAAVLSSSSCHGLRGVGCHTIIVSKYCATHRKCVHAYTHTWLILPMPHRRPAEGHRYLYNASVGWPCNTQLQSFYERFSVLRRQQTRE